MAEQRAGIREADLVLGGTDILLGTLKDKGFPTQLTQGPKDLMRVLVGPYSDRQSLGKAKTELENLGLHPIMR